MECNWFGFSTNLGKYEKNAKFDSKEGIFAIFRSQYQIKPNSYQWIFDIILLDKEIVPNRVVNFMD